MKISNRLRKTLSEIPREIIEEQVEALRLTKEEYKSGTHSPTFIGCKLCNVVRNETGIMECCLCPWMWIAQQLCVDRYPDIQRLHNGPDDPVVKNRIRQISTWIHMLELYLEEV